MSIILKVCGIIYAIVSGVIAVWLYSDYGTIEIVKDAYSLTTETVSNPVAMNMALGIGFQGIFMFALSFGVACVIDNTEKIMLQLKAMNMDGTDDETINDPFEDAEIIMNEKNVIHEKGLGIGHEECSVCITEAGLIIKTINKDYKLPFQRIYQSVYLQNKSTINEIQSFLDGVEIIDDKETQEFLTRVIGSEKALDDRKYLAIIFYNKDGNVSIMALQGNRLNNFIRMEKEINSRIIK